MSEYRAAIDRFAGIAIRASCREKRKWKRPKLANMGKIKSEDTHLEKQKTYKVQKVPKLGKRED